MATVAFKTFGCRLNRAETEHFAAAFAEAGVRTVPFGEPADIVVVHTCAVTKTAERECLRIARVSRAKHPGAIMVLSGCGVEAAQERELRSLGMDIVVHRSDRERLVELVLQRLPQRQTTPQCFAPSLQRALLKVQDGCDCFCTYCIVPHTRGEPWSKPLAQCLDEAREFLRQGFREIVVVGCNVAFWQDGALRLPDLLSAICSLGDGFRVRLSSLEPGVCDEGVIELMAERKNFCNFLHLPLQHASDRVLARMGRKYGNADLRRLLDFICGKIPLLGLGADLITGFPGETEEDFSETERLVRDYPFSNLHVFPYSERPGTPAAEFSDQVPIAERKARAHRLIELREIKKREFAARHEGLEVEVLIERVENGIGRGWTEDYLECLVPDTSENDIGDLSKVIWRLK